MGRMRNEKVKENVKYGRSSDEIPIGRRFLPFVARANAVENLMQALKGNSFQSVSPAPFVGRFGYPRVNVGLLAPPAAPVEPELLDAPRQWSERRFDIPKIVHIRSSLVNAYKKLDIAAPANPDSHLQVAQEIAMAQKPAELSVEIVKRPKFGLAMSDVVPPMGPTAELKHAELENRKINPAMEKAYYDTDLKAAEAIEFLAKHEHDENTISKALSVGTLGIGKNRKLVPTRWAITAIDDTIGKRIIEDIRIFEHVVETQVFSGGYMGNQYVVLLLPGEWSYELFEISVSSKLGIGKIWTDYEGFQGRKDYADNTVGGYYAARLAILEKMWEMKIQASIFCLRFVTEDYAVPLGVWVVREATRDAMKSQPLKFGNRKLALSYAAVVAKRKFGIDLTPIIQKSLLLRQTTRQEQLSMFS